MLKWLILFTPIISFSQTVDTLSNAYAVRNTYDHIPINGIMNNGHIYGIGMSQQYINGITPTLIRFTLIDYATKQVQQKDLLGTTSTTNGVVWRYVMDSLGRIVMGLNSGNRFIMRFNLKADSISYENFGNGFYSNTGTLAYSVILNANRTMTLGGSSTDATQVSILYENGYIKKIPEIDPTQGYTTQSYMDTGRYAYAQVGQDPFRLYAVDTLTGIKTLMEERSDGFPIAFGNSTNGIYARPSAVAPYNKLVNGAFVTIPPAPSGVGSVAYEEVKIFTDQPNNPRPLVTNFWDAEHSTLHWEINHVHDSTRLDTDSIRDGISRVLPMGRYIFYTANYYGGMYRYDTLTHERTFLGNPAMNVYAMLKYNDSIIYMSGYGSGILEEYNINQPWTVGTYYNGSGRPPSSTSNPKFITYWHNYSEISHAYKLIKLPNGIIATMGDIIRTGNSANIAFYNPATQQAWGYSSDSMYLQAESDIAICGTKYVLFSTNNNNGGRAKIFKYDTELHMMVDSLDFGFKNYGKIFCTGDLLFGIAQDTSNPTHQIDTTRFYKVNMSTHQLIYSTKVRATLNKVQFMPDGVIGINMTYTDGQIVPIPVAPPAGYALTRVIQNLDYYYNNNKSYITIGETLLQNKGITNSTIDMNTAAGKQQYLINWLR